MSKTSQTDKYLWATTFSHYLGQMHYRNEKKKLYDFDIKLTPDRNSNNRLNLNERRHPIYHFDP